MSPQETLSLLAENPDIQTELFQDKDKKPGDWINLFDHTKYRSEIFQRPFLYLRLLQNPAQRAELDACLYTHRPLGLEARQECLTLLLEKFCVKQPTWMELTHFSSFLNTQLRSSETSFYCNADLVAEEFPGMKAFVIHFLIQMSKDFASRSVDISDQSEGDGFSRPEIEERHRWENSPHPYIFFNEDGHTMSFFGFTLQRVDRIVNLLDERTSQILVHQIMTSRLYVGLDANRVPFNQPFEQKTTEKKLEEICNVLGIKTLAQHPDLSYELTADNVMKMLAIYMRFRCNIPVVIMGTF